MEALAPGPVSLGLLGQGAVLGRTVVGVALERFVFVFHIQLELVVLHHLIHRSRLILRGGAKSPRGLVSAHSSCYLAGLCAWVVGIIGQAKGPRSAAFGLQLTRSDSYVSSAAGCVHTRVLALLSKDSSARISDGCAARVQSVRRTAPTHLCVPPPPRHGIPAARQPSQFRSG